MADVAALAARVEALTAGGLAAVHVRGHAWVEAELLPAIYALEAALEEAPANRTEVARVAFSVACYLVGDLHDLHDAPNAAIAAYTRSLRLDPTHASAWRELGTCQLELGEVELARASLEQALRLEPDDEHALRELAELEAGCGPRYEPGDRCWAAADALASRAPDRALELLEGLESDEAVQRRACARALLGDRAGLLAELARLPRAPDRDALRYYVPVELHAEPEVARLLGP